jgi:hypothetical protein
MHPQHAPPTPSPKWHLQQLDSSIASKFTTRHN